MPNSGAIGLDQLPILMIIISKHLWFHICIIFLNLRNLSTFIVGHLLISVLFCCSLRSATLHLGLNWRFYNFTFVLLLLFDDLVQLCWNFKVVLLAVVVLTMVQHVLIVFHLLLERVESDLIKYRIYHFKHTFVSKFILIPHLIELFSILISLSLGDSCSF